MDRVVLRVATPSDRDAIEALLHEAYGFRRDETEITMPDGVGLACVAMSKPVDP